MQSIATIEAQESIASKAPEQKKEGGVVLLCWYGRGTQQRGESERGATQGGCSDGDHWHSLCH